MKSDEITDVVICPRCRNNKTICSLCNDFGFVYRLTKISYSAIKQPKETNK